MMRRVAQRMATPAMAVAVASALRAAADAVPERRPLHKFDNFMSGASADWFEDQFEQFRKDPNSVHPSMAKIFESVEAEADPEKPILTEARTVVDLNSQLKPKKIGIKQSLTQSRRLMSLIQAYERDGHLFAQLDPLHYDRGAKRDPGLKQSLRMNLHPKAFGFSEDDFEKTFCVGFHDGVGGLFDANTGPMTLKQIHERVKRAYCGTIGYEFMHIYDEKVLHWLRERIECPQRVWENPLDAEMTTKERENIFGMLSNAVEFELFFKAKFPTMKRFGSDGSESFIVGLESAIERAASHGVQEVVIGMAHRGRLSVLHNICGKPYEALLTEFRGIKKSDVLDLSDNGDVKYHRGMRTTRQLRTGAEVTVEVLNNPSHLETVNPIVQGYVRNAQLTRGDELGHRVLPIEIHGDAAFSGQGVVFETMGLASIGKFNTGGTIHVVINNQVGFTTSPIDSRSSTHCSDVGRTFQLPVFHVNGDSVEDVARVFRLAADYRAHFGRSVIIDLVCYRRFGHNENDTPHFTQPMLYKVVDKRKNILNLYKNQLIEYGLEEKSLDAINQQAKSKYRTAFEKVEKGEFDYKKFQRECIRTEWKDFEIGFEDAKMFPTAISREKLAPVVAAMKTLPEGFEAHRTLQGILRKRAESLDSGVGIEWGTAEALAIGSLLVDGYAVRMSGQDVERATFSQRHAVLHDQNNDQTYTQLANIQGAKAPLTITNSSLSEYGVLGFEYGYGLRDPKTMALWEAQFADFANGAQIIIDQYITASLHKWRQQANVVLSMPHGNDGNGPEHSSGRIERFLQANTETDALEEMSVLERHFHGNVEVTVPTTPKQYFHLLRRHMLRNFRRPLINFFSKQFIRAPNTSTLDELIEGEFEPLMDADKGNVAPTKIRRIIFTVGQVYHMIAIEKEAKKINDVALLRLEQLAPMPLAEIKAALKKYPNAEVCFAQEEPKNMGAFNFVEPHLLRLTNYERPVRFVGRLAGPSPATGYSSIWKHENKAMVEDALKP